MVKMTNALGAQKVLPETIIFKQVPLSINLPMQPLYGLSGAVKTGKSTILPRQIALEGRIYYPGDKERIRQELDAILAFLMHPPIEVYRHHTHERFLRAYPLGAPQDWIDGGAELGLRIPMIALDPYWYGQEVTVQVSGTQTIVVDGTAPAHPLVRTINSVAGLTLQNPALGQELIVDGTGEIEVDNVEFTCKINGNNRLDAVNREWLLSGFSLVPGANEIITSAPVELIYRPRWY